LKGRYQYVLAVHSDHEHLHAHIIFNNINAYNGLSFTYEENQGGRRERAWAKLREISDEICQEHKLSVITEPEKGMGISHYERDMQIEGKSWKEKLRHKLAKIIMKSGSFEDFLRRCRKKDIEVVYEPTHKYKLKFRLEGQQRFVRGETLGEFYTADAIAEQIELIYKMAEENMRKANAEPIPKPLPTIIVPKPQVTPSVTTPPKTEPTDRVVITAEEFLTGTSPQDKPTATVEPIEKPSEKEEFEVDPWAEIREVGRSDEMIQALEKAGIMSYHELSYFMLNGSKHPQDHSDEIETRKERIKQLEMLIKSMQQRDRLSTIYTEYQEKSGWFQSHYERKHHDEICDYRTAVAYIKKHIDDFKGKDGKTPTLKDLQAKLKRLKTKLKALEDENAIYETKSRLAYPHIKKIRQYRMDKANKRARELSNEKLRSRQKKKTYLE